ncbi:MAG: efflux transporter outer membrane subunit [Thermoanaerobaculia bacterium]|jgi:multidrug efflux system outer membrane protein
MKRTLLIVLLLAVATTGCMLGPANQRPPIPTPEVWREGPAAEESIANLEWWSIYDDPALQDLIRQSIAENKDLRVAMERVVEARARYGVSRADLWPQINASGTAGYFDEGDLNDFTENDEVYSVGADLSWEIDLFGRVRSGNQAAWSSYLATEQAQRAATLTLVFSVARAYFELCDLDQELEITKATLESRRHYMQLVKSLFEGGVRSEIDFRQAEGEYYGVDIRVKDIERQIVSKENELSFLIGKNPGPITRGRPIGEQKIAETIPSGLPSSLLERRPDVVAAEQQLFAANAQIGVARSLMFPRIAITGAYGGTADDISNVFDSANVVSNLLGNIFQPIFQAGRLRRNVEVTESQQRQALSAYEQAILAAFRETEDSLVTYQKTTEQRSSYGARVEALREVLRLNELAYEGGVVDYLRVLDAQRTLLDAELSAVQNNRQQLVALASVYKALGGGWNPEPPETEGTQPAAATPPAPTN